MNVLRQTRLAGIGQRHHGFMEFGKASHDQLAALFVSICLISTFLPAKIYPILFVLFAIYIFSFHGTILVANWVVWMALFTGYVLMSFSVGYLSDVHVSEYIRHIQFLNAPKIAINFVFLVAALQWSLKCPRGETQPIDWFDRSLSLTFLLSALQLFAYHAHTGFTHLGAPSNSYVAAEIYDPKLAYWGGDDKNILGARIAMFGFVWLLIRLMRTRKIPWWRLAVVGSVAWLSASRTPMFALAIGIVYVMLRRSGWKGRIAVVLLTAALIPIMLNRVLRIDVLFAGNDGMGIRLIYWATFFRNLSDISPFGNGFMSAESFLTRFSPRYLGEPHLHNLWFTDYLDFGFPGVIFYTAFLWTLYRWCKRKAPVAETWYWSASFVPMIAIMLTLYTGYEADVVLYLFGMFALARSLPRPLDNAVLA